MTMRRTYFLTSVLSLLLFIIISCKDDPSKTNCAKFKTGEFFIKAKNNSPSYLIRRTDSLQYETDEKTKGVRIFDVKWTNPCEYELRLIHKPSDSATLNQSEFRNTIEKINTKIAIVKMAETYYIFKARKEGVSMVVTDTIWLRNNFIK